MQQKNILIICGEPSGELHAANLTLAIRKIAPEIKITGVGGALLAKAGADIIYDIKGLSVMGLFDVLKKLPRFFALKRMILDKLSSDKFDAVIFVDFSGFNLRLAKTINNRIPAIYYVSPQIWASRPGRIETIRKYIRKVIVLFEFEKNFYKKYGMNVDCVGHALLDIVNPTMAKDELLQKLNLAKEKKTIALLPGSRKQEIRKILPIMLKTAHIMNKNNEFQFVIAKAAQADWKVYDKIIKKSGVETKFLEGKTYDALNIADFALVCSGTATLEAAIMQKPFFIIYKMNLLNYLLYRPQVKIPYIGIVNIVAGKRIVPEFIQFQAQPEKIAALALETLKNRVKLENMRIELDEVKSALGSPGAAHRAAKLVIDFLNS
ncbi:MAG: lipid-A-disaccharide synthase [Candidatus Omnitrophica bacterium]|nr:lipid-A-disaccharide synthase [Candidatus Omnitrophota bacterium]